MGSGSKSCGVTTSGFPRVLVPMVIVVVVLLVIVVLVVRVVVYGLW